MITDTRFHAPRGNAIRRGSASRAMPCRFAALAGLLGAAVVITVVWTFVLPRIGGLPSVRASIDRREALGINAEAMFYTELEAMDTLQVKWDAEQVQETGD